MTVPAAPADLADWLRLQAVPGVGPATARRLLAAFGSPQALWSASDVALAQVVSASLAKALRQVPPDLPQALAGIEQWLSHAEPDVPRHVLTLSDPRYPARLLDVADPPLVLLAEGRLALVHAPAIAMVGSRRATPDGLDHARSIALALSRAGVTVVSGLAAGIDAAAHEGALQAVHEPGRLVAPAGSTVAVLGTGPDADSIYPRRHQALARRVAREGLLITEFLPGTQARPDHFPRRNRLVAALGLGTLVVEAALPSGSLITARLALDMGREVMALPGSLRSPQSRGCHALIKQGAWLIEEASDILAALDLTGNGPVVSGASPASMAAQVDAVDAADAGLLTAMGYDPVGLDALTARTGLGAAELGVSLLQLELQGCVLRLPGQLFQRVAAA